MSTIDPTIFRSYDIRGIVDQDLTEAAVERIGLAYGTLAIGRGAKRLTVGQDCRDSSPRLFRALVRGLTQTGIHVLDVGTVATPMQYFSIPHFGADGGVQITGLVLVRETVLVNVIEQFLVELIHAALEDEPMSEVVWMDTVSDVGGVWHWEIRIAAGVRRI